MKAIIFNAYSFKKEFLKRNSTGHHNFLSSTALHNKAELTLQNFHCW